MPQWLRGRAANINKGKMYILDDDIEFIRSGSDPILGNFLIYWGHMQIVWFLFFRKSIMVWLMWILSHTMGSWRLQYGT